MLPTLTWLDLTAKDREKMRRVLDLLNEQGTVDELGLGGLRDTLADALFPGTSTIQTRLRYMLFVPWIYRRIEAQGVPGRHFEQTAQAAERALIEVLKQADEDGVLGARSGRALKRLPSGVYWGGLVRWGIFQHAQSQSWYLAQGPSIASARQLSGRADDPGVVWAAKPSWHPRMPEAPKGFPQGATFDLTSAEAEFLQGRIEERCAGSLLAWLAREGSIPPTGAFWDADIVRAPGSIRETVELARRFSLHVEGAPLLYNLMLAERGHALNGERQSYIEKYRRQLLEWAGRESDEEAFQPRAMWHFAAQRGARVSSGQQRFLEDWSKRLTEIGAEAAPDDALLRARIEARELQLKGARARFVNERRLLDLRGDVGLGRMEFRWFRVRQMLTDLHRGLVS